MEHYLKYHQFLDFWGYRLLDCPSETERKANGLGRAMDEGERKDIADYGLPVGLPTVRENSI